jgi:hypothetical protein
VLLRLVETNVYLDRRTIIKNHYIQFGESKDMKAKGKITFE